MILVYRSDKSIHQSIFGFGDVTTQNGNLYIDGIDTTTCAADVAWKYIADQTIERDDSGAYLHDADYYEAVAPEPTEKERLAAVEDLLAALVEG